MLPSKREPATKNIRELLSQVNRLKENTTPTKPIHISFPTPPTPPTPASQAESIDSTIYSIHIEGRSYDSPIESLANSKPEDIKSIQTVLSDKSSTPKDPLFDILTLYSIPAYSESDKSEEPLAESSTEQSVSEQSSLQSPDKPETPQTTESFDSAIEYIPDEQGASETEGKSSVETSSSAFFQRSILNNLKELKNEHTTVTIDKSMHIDENGVSPLHFFSANIFSDDGSSFIPETIQSIVKSITNSEGDFTNEAIPQEDYLAKNVYTPRTVREYYDKYFFLDKNGLTPVDTIILAAKSAGKEPDELKDALEKVLTTEYPIAGGSKTEEGSPVEPNTLPATTSLKFYNPLSLLVDEKNLELYNELYKTSKSSSDSSPPSDSAYEFLSQIQQMNKEKSESEPTPDAKSDTTNETVSIADQQQPCYYFIQGDLTKDNTPDNLELKKIANLNNEITKIMMNNTTTVSHVIYFNCAFKQIEIKTIEPILTKLNITNYTGYKFKILIELKNDNLSQFDQEHTVYYLFLYKPTSPTIGGSPSMSLHSLSSQLESLFKLRLP